MIERFIDFFTGLSGAWVAGAVLLFSAAESALLVGFICPGELAVVLGGVLCSRGEASIWLVAPAAVVGAALGDSAAWWCGRRWGAPFMERHHGRYWPRAAAFLRRHGGPAVFVGRFQAVLRSLMPSAAGAAGIPYRTFLPWNAASCLVTGTGFTLAGYLAGERYQDLLGYARSGGLAVIAVVGLVVLVAWWRVRRAIRRGLGGPPPP